MISPLRLAAVFAFGFALAGPALADVYVANQNCSSVTVYGTGAVGNAAPVRTIAGPATGFDTPSTVVADTVNNELYVTDFFGQAVRVFPLGANGNAAPVRTLSGPSTALGQPRMVAVDTVHNEIIVATTTGDGIRIFSRLANGNVAPVRTIAGAATKINNPASIGYNPLTDEIFIDSYNVGGPNLPGILVFNRLDSGNVAPKRAIAGSNTQFGQFTNYLTLDVANGEVFAEGSEGHGIVVFNLTDNGNVAPKRHLTGPATGIFGIGGIRVDNVNNRVIATNQGQDFSGDQLLVYPRTATGNTKPLMSIAGPATGLCNPLGLEVDTTGGFTALIADSTPPVVVPQSVTTVRDVPVTVTLTATDPGNTTFLFMITMFPAHGSIDSFNPFTGTLTYRPDPGYVGADSFTFVASDGVNVSAPAVVSITVTQPSGIPTLDLSALLALTLLLATAGVAALRR